MAIESATYISQLDATLPAAGDLKSEGDDHMRLLKAAVKATFPNITGAVTPTHLELNYVAGVTSGIQAQINAKAPSASPVFTVAATLPAATTIGAVTATQIAALGGVTSDVQAQINAEITNRTNADNLLAPRSSPTLTGTPTAPTAAAGTATTQLATTAFVAAQAFASALPGQTGNAGKVVTTDGTTAGWVNPGGLFYSARTLNTTLIADDRNFLIDISIGSGSFALAFSPCAALGNGWKIWLRNTGGASLVLDPDGVELIDGVASLTLYPGEARLIQCDGLALRTIRVEGGMIDLPTGANIASAATVNLNTATGNRVHITGTTTITAVTLTRGPRTVIFDGILTLTHHATNNNLPGAANITTAAGDRAIYESDGTTVYCVSYIKVSGAAVVGGGAGNHSVVVNTGNGYGSTNTAIRRFTTALVNVGTAITYADSAANGATFTINESGLYAITYGDARTTTGSYFGASLNSSELTTIFQSINSANKLCSTSSAVANSITSTSVVVRLSSGGIVRAHAGGPTNDGAAYNIFSITKVGL